MLTRKRFSDGLAELVGRDPDLAGILTAIGPPPLWRRDPGFPTLVQIILEQQVSLASARAAFDRLQTRLGRVTPERFASLSDRGLKTIGFSRQKARYCRALAAAISTGEFSIDRLARLSDDEARAALMRQVGIGRWTADIYLLMALRRPDVWPSGDLALAKAVQEVKGLASIPDAGELDAVSESWRPWRAVAARLLWHHYLSR